MANTKTVSVVFDGSSDAVDRALQSMAEHADQTGARMQVLRDQVDELGNARAAATVTVDDGDAEAKLVAFKARLSELSAQGITLNVVDGDATARIEAVKGRLDDLSGRVAVARISLAGNDEAQAKLSSIEASLDRVDRKTSSPRVNLQGVAQSEADLFALEARLDKIGQTEAKPKVDTAEAQAGLAGLKAGLIGLAPAAVEVGTVAAGALAALPVALLPLVGAIPEVKSGLTEVERITESVGARNNEVGTTIQQLISDYMAFVNSARGTQDINQMLVAGNVFWRQMASAIESVTGGLFNMGAEASPILEQIGAGAEMIAQRFNQWTTDGGAEKFFAYVEQHGPEVAHLFDEVATAVVHFGEDEAAIAPAVMPLVEALGKLLNLPGAGELIALGVTLGGIGLEVVKLGSAIDTLITKFPEMASKAVAAVSSIMSKFQDWLYADEAAQQGLTNVGASAQQMGAETSAAAGQADTAVAGVGASAQQAAGEVVTAGTEADTAISSVGAASDTTATQVGTIGMAAQEMATEVDAASAEADTSIAGIGTAAETSAGQVEALGAAEGSAGGIGGMGAAGGILGGGALGGIADLAGGGLMGLGLVGGIVGLSALDGYEVYKALNPPGPTVQQISPTAFGDWTPAPGPGQAPLSATAAQGPQITVNSPVTVQGNLDNVTQTQLQQTLAEHSTNIATSIGQMIGAPQR
ncbi:MAG TPA: hypothetical protein VFP54_10960 [Acidimicrobiales bacterium]|nr:hypothetical protein [Acidimicrobiales bacterium]